MKRNQIGPVLAIAFISMVMVVGLFVRLHHREAATSMHSLQTKPPLPTATSPPTVTGMNPAASPYSPIASQATKVLQAYYYLEAGDTPISRRQRLERTKLVPPAVLNQLNLSVGASSCQDRARRQLHLTMQASVNPTDVHAQAVSNDATNVYMTVPVIVVAVQPNGKEYFGSANCVMTRRIVPYFTWRKIGDQWTMQSFVDPEAMQRD